MCGLSGQGSGDRVTVFGDRNLEQTPQESSALLQRFVLHTVILNTHLFNTQSLG